MSPSSLKVSLPQLLSAEGRGLDGLEKAKAEPGVQAIVNHGLVDLFIPAID